MSYICKCKCNNSLLACRVLLTLLHNILAMLLYYQTAYTRAINAPLAVTRPCSCTGCRILSKTAKAQSQSSSVQLNAAAVKQLSSMSASQGLEGAGETGGKPIR
jgi:hypothetical protein